ncbi:MAG TPA: metalloregulator ArsR/SmtB family transcription factor [Syntrophomonas sp.]|nr:metalloregulator ArsR/SmtB family transcription factor [Syntrophomonas sp.]
MNLLELKPEQLEKAANMLKALAHPVRISILNLLKEDEKLTVTEIHEKLNIEQSTASHHLGILKDKDVLASKRDGKNTYYFVKHSEMSLIIDCISNCSCGE